MMRTIWTAAGTALALAACGDGQTGSGYRGEPLMSLRGVVTSSSAALAEDLVPALHFFSMEEFAMGGETFTTYFVKSEVEGTFPSAFTMNIYEPPPDEVLIAWFDGEPSYTMGQIAAVSPDHPRRLRRTAYEEPIVDDAGMVIGGIQRDELCSDTGECLSRYPSNCAEGEQDPNSEWPCGVTFPDEFPWEVYGYSDQYMVLYLDGDAPAGSVLSRLFRGGEMIPAGYHGARRIDDTTLPAEEAAARAECMMNAYIRSTEDANAIFGTNATFPDTSEFSSLEQQIELQRLQMIALADFGCDVLIELIEDPSSEPIELPFTDQPQRFTL